MPYNDFGFILTRHVTNEQTNKYWNQSIKLIRTHYPEKRIIIIDDNSNKRFVKCDHIYNNLTIVESEFIGRGEILPYYYLLKHKWFPNAVIIHDSIFIHKRIPFERINVPILPFWHAPYDRENINNIFRITGALNNNYEIINMLRDTDIKILGNKENKFELCFGTQAFISLTFLQQLEAKYKISNLVNVVTTRTDRCSLERIMGAVFFNEYKPLKKIRSLFGNIFLFPNAWDYSWTDYMADIKNERIPHIFIKIWTGR